jgi:protein TonB
VNYNFRASEMARRVESTRREAEDLRLRKIRSEVAAQVAEREPPPPPPPPPPPKRHGQIEYNVQATRQTSILNAPLPVYPDALVQKGAAGTITLQVTIGPDGNVSRAAIASSQLPEMDAALLASVKKWTFTPAAGARGPVAFDGKIVVRFTVQ